MGKRTRIGLNLFFDNHSNSGIVNYIYNIVAALNTLPEDKQPEVVLLYNSGSPVDYIRGIGYPKLTTIFFALEPYRPVVKKVNTLLEKITGRNFFKYIKYYRKFDVLYPYFEMINPPFSDYSNKIHWMVDFNNRAFPDHYPDKTMEIYQRRVTALSDKIVLSSDTLKNELKQYYPDYRNEVLVLRFASTIVLNKEQEIDTVKKKVGLDGVDYFMSPNQFWEHKNQIVVFEALNELKENFAPGRFKIVFTGSMDVNRGKGKYSDVLTKKIAEYGLEEYVVFTGVLDRQDQLALMKHSIALIQPSLYEGWSTLVEEAKALGKFIILSDLPVHREQINKNVAFFEPKNSKALANLLQNELVKPTVVEPIDYSNNIKDFGNKIIELLK